MTLWSRLSTLFQRHRAPDESNVDLVESLLAEQQFRADKLRRETAIDAALDIAHAHAVRDDRTLRREQTRFGRRLRSLK